MSPWWLAGRKRDVASVADEIETRIREAGRSVPNVSWGPRSLEMLVSVPMSELMPALRRLERDGRLIYNGSFGSYRLPWDRR